MGTVGAHPSAVHGWLAVRWPVTVPPGLAVVKPAGPASVVRALLRWPA
ncbi:hypothetical protein ACQP2P_16020 [Dactylosporangium sp. CA-139114]